MIKNTYRNNTVDIIRGTAMLMVVLQHTIARCCADYSSTFLFNAIWSLQMPLFFMVSGYVTRYSKTVVSFGDLFGLIKRRTCAYLIPWLVWSFIIRGFIFEYKQFESISYLLWHMDTGYWFLFSLWSIVIIDSLSEFFASKLNTTSVTARIVVQTVFVIIGAAVLLLFGYFWGFDFLAIKLTLFYLPLYIAGSIWGKIQDYASRKIRFQIFKNIIGGISILIWIYLIRRIVLFGVEMSASLLIIRYLTSICGCLSLICLVDFSHRYLLPFAKAGLYSLQIYLVHYLFLAPLTIGASEKLNLLTLSGFTVVTVNYLLTIGLVILSINLIKNNSYLNKLLFWK